MFSVEIGMVVVVGGGGGIKAWNLEVGKGFS